MGLLGRGSFAKVYRAQSLIDNSVVALKIIDKRSKIIDAAMEPRIISEISAMKRLHHHPNILKIHEVMATKTKICLVMELAAGGELFSQLVSKGRLPESVARRYLQQLVSALNFCHENGVAHRDVKPQNLLLDKDGNLKVSDFGLSALPDRLKDGLLHTACGTPAYTAPEVVCRRGGYDGTKADAWSCGVILFVLLSGFHPFDDSNLINMYRKMHRREYKLPSTISISKSARTIITHLLNPNPVTRMSIRALTETSWFKKSLKLTPETSLFDSVPPQVTGVNMINAFDIISLSSGLDLSGLFEPNKKDKRFTSMASSEVVSERVREIGVKLGYKVEKGKGGAIAMGKGRLVLIVELLEVTQSLLLVEVKVVDGGIDFDELYWGDLKTELQGIVLSWHTVAV